MYCIYNEVALYSDINNFHPLDMPLVVVRCAGVQPRIGGDSTCRIQGLHSRSVVMITCNLAAGLHLNTLCPTQDVSYLTPSLRSSKDFGSAEGSTRPMNTIHMISKQFISFRHLQMIAFIWICRMVLPSVSSRLILKWA
jgi:hypothetical protein